MSIKKPPSPLVHNEGDEMRRPLTSLYLKTVDRRVDAYQKVKESESISLLLDEHMTRVDAYIKKLKSESKTFSLFLDEHMEM
ncbi:hypothetical protein APHAL10511_007901 [Amanita phalloides]|nr:hypothetical protein APHAL10511_007901 [Amanita phalloides]